MFKRILMNAADTSPGNGAVPPPAAVPPTTATPAPGAPTPNPLEDLVTRLATQVETLSKSVNSLHATDRRVREGKPPAKSDDKDGTVPIADDPSSLLALRDAFDDSTSDLKLTKGQRQLVREAVMAKRLHPGDVDGFVTDYVSRAGWTATNASTPSAPAAAATPLAPTNDRPASDRGSPPPPKVPLAEADLLTMSDSDRAALIREKGIKWFVEKTRAQGKGRAVAFR
jgi:hypothetical protein